MARQTRPLTNTEVKSAKSSNKDVILYDGDGLELLIKHPSNSKLWRFRYYRPVNKKRAMISLGAYPEISLAEARKLKEEARGLLACDIDPQEHKKNRLDSRQKNNENTFLKVAQDWFEVKRARNLTEASLDDIWRSLVNYAFPAVGHVPIADLTARDFIDALKPASALGKAETVRRVCARINQVMDYAVNVGLIDLNPASRISQAFAPPTRKHMPTIRPEELPNFMQRLSISRLEIKTRLLIEWQLLTMSRPSEAAGTRWEEIDFDAKEWTIPADRLKQRREHIIPLSKQAMAILEVMYPASGHREHVFPSMSNPNRPMSAETPNQAIKRMGYAGRLVAHGLRSIASTALNEEGFSSDIIEAALSHMDKNEVRRAYNRSTYLEQRRPLMAWWGDFVERAATGNYSAASGVKGLKVVGGYE